MRSAVWEQVAGLKRLGDIDRKAVLAWLSTVDVPTECEALSTRARREVFARVQVHLSVVRMVRRSGALSQKLPERVAALLQNEAKLFARKTLSDR